jgi:hypothetical protein
MSFYPNDDYKKLGLSPRWVFTVWNELDPPLGGVLYDLYMSGSSQSGSFEIRHPKNPINLGPYYISSKIIRLDSIEFECGWLKGMQSVSGFNIQLSDTAKEYSSRPSLSSIIGKEVILYLYFAENIPAILSEDYIVWKGFIDQVSFDNSTIKLNCVDNSLSQLDNKTLPNKSKMIVQNGEETVPEDIVGKFKPVVYGEVDYSPCLMSLNSQKETFLGVVDDLSYVRDGNGNVKAAPGLGVKWMSPTRPNTGELAGKYIKIVAGNDSTASLTPDEDDQSMAGIIKRVLYNSGAANEGDLDLLTLDSWYKRPDPRLMKTSQYGVMIEVLEADMQYTCFEESDTDDFDNLGFQIDPVNNVASPLYIWDDGSKSFLQLDSTQYYYATKTQSPFVQYTNIITFHPNYLIGRDKVNLVLGWVRPKLAFNPNTGIREIKVNSVGGHGAWSSLDHAIDGSMTSYANWTIDKEVRYNEEWALALYDMADVFEFLKTTGKEYNNFDKVCLAMKFSYKFKDKMTIAGLKSGGFSIAVGAHPYHPNIYSNPAYYPAADTKFVVFDYWNSVYYTFIQSGNIFTIINSLPLSVDSSGSDDKYRELKATLIEGGNAESFLNYMLGITVKAGLRSTTSGAAQTVQAQIHLFDLRFIFERSIDLADKKILYGYIKGRKDFKTAGSQLISVNTFQDDAFFVLPHLLISENSLSKTLFDDATAWPMKATSDSSRLRFNFCLTEDIKTTEFLEKVAEQTCEKIVVDKDGNWRHSKFNTSKTFKVSGTNTPANFDIFDYVGEYSGEPATFTKHGLLQLGDILLTDIGDCYNNFILKYKINYATKEYERMVYMYQDGTNNITESYLDGTTVGNLQSLIAASPALNETKFELEMDLVRDDITATRVLQRYIEAYYKRRWTIRFKAWWSAITHNVGDVINIRHPTINTMFADYATKKWEIYYKNINMSGGIEFDVVELT